MFSPKDATKISKEIEMNVWIISLFLILLGVLLSTRENFDTLDNQISALEAEIRGLHVAKGLMIKKLFPEQVQLYNQSIQFRRQELNRLKRLLNATKVQDEYAHENMKKETSSSLAYYAFSLLTSFLFPIGL